MFNQTSTWVVVADACHAKIYRMTKFPKIEDVCAFEHPESRMHNKALVGVKPGRGFQRGGGIRYSYQSELEPKQIETNKFAIYLAEFLNKSRENGEFRRLYLIAGPTFLGLLRKHLNPQLRRMVVHEVNKELTSFDGNVIEHYLEAI